MSRGAKVTVAGAGALGLASALALVDAGCEVTVCDPAEPGANASGVAAGMLAPVLEATLDSEAAPHFDLLLAARDLWPALEARAAVPLGRTGALAVGAPGWLAEVAAGIARLGLRATELPRNAAEALAPGLSEVFAQALLTREDWRLDAPAALAALRRAAADAGVGFAQRPVRGLVGADWLVVATGPAQALAPESGHLAPVKGHILRARASGIGGVTVRGEKAYAVPMAGGLAVGATMEAGIADPAVDPAKAAPLVEAGVRLFPDLAHAAYDLFAGVRAATPDGLPMAGFSREPRVLVAAGARRNGWLLAPLVARVIAACVTGGDPGPYAARLDPRRFARG